MTDKENLACREEFERLFSKKENYPLIIGEERYWKGQYIYVNTRNAWKGWQACWNTRINIASKKTDGELVKEIENICDSLTIGINCNEAVYGALHALRIRVIAALSANNGGI